MKPSIHPGEMKGIRNPFFRSQQVWIGLFITFTILCNVFKTNAQTSKFPIYNDQRIPKPAGLKSFQPGDFKIDLNRLNRYPNGYLFGSRESLLKLGEFLLSDPDGRKLWDTEAGNAAKTLNRYDFERVGFGAERYVKCTSQLQELSLVYLFTGHKELGNFIRAHLLQIARLPFEFWVHAELRGYNPVKPMGGLETASLCSTVAASLSATAELYSPAEKNSIEAALHEKGLQPCLNWLEKPRANNWTAVVSRGTFLAANYFNDPKAEGIGLKEMANYLNTTVETDGSYGEGMGYFHYPIGTLLPALLVMDREQRSKLFSETGLRHSASWKVYPYLYATDREGGIRSDIIHFGDNSYAGPENDSVNLMLALLYQDPLAAWMMKKFGSSTSVMEKLLLYSFPEGLPEPKSPEQLNLPLVRTFSSGDCFIRSTWNENGIVLGMRSGDGSRIKFAHQRPELGSICMGAYGEYMVASPGSASYRSPLHYQWDRATRSANTITIDDQNQLFPGSGESSWNTTDVSGFWQQGQPKAEVVQCKAGLLADLIVNELAQAYHVPMKHVRRSVLFVHDPGYFVIVDRIESVDGLHKYTWRLHLNNKDESGKVIETGKNHWNFQRPNAGLDISLFADKPVQSKVGKGYLHGPGRDYSPGGINEGKEGSSAEIEAFNPVKGNLLTYYTVLFPVKKGTTAPATAFTGKTLTIGKDVLTFREGEFSLEKAGKTESFKLW